MRRYKLILGGTAAGIAGVLLFPTHEGGNLSATATSTSATTGGTASPTTATAPHGTTTTPSSTTSPSTTTGAPQSATSDTEHYPYGNLSVKVTVTGSKITGVSIAAINETDSRSVSIDDYAIPRLEQQVIAAGSVKVDGVSGATFTSQAFVDGVSNALQKLGISS